MNDHLSLEEKSVIEKQSMSKRKTLARALGTTYDLPPAKEQIIGGGKLVSYKRTNSRTERPMVMLPEVINADETVVPAVYLEQSNARAYAEELLRIVNEAGL